MRILKIIILSIFIYLATFGMVQINRAEAAVNPYIPNCLGISGKFYANQTWKGGYIMVGCAGDDGGAVNQDPNRWCKGEVQKVWPGKSFRLTKCSCFDKEGCLKIGKDLSRSSTLNANRRYTITVDRRIDEMPVFINNGCVINKIGKMCGSNGQIIKPTIKITCDVPQSKVPTSTPTPTGQTCPIPEKVQNVKITCPNCTPSSSNNSISPTPTTAATITPTITVEPSETLTPTPTVASLN